MNPLQSKRAKWTQLRKVKTDALDAWHLADMYYRGDVKLQRTWNILNIITQIKVSNF
ncbi:hypothetical protein ACFCW7_23135 [Paenibacillus glucanolyticus]|uniref:IS110 family transposase n=1 Tax=Paenibacillus glucanolyticus TaxID=59843 RepID=UPI001F19400E|nr:MULTISPECIES: IS110 family transposase [Paenibacillus]